MNEERLIVNLQLHVNRHRTTVRSFGLAEDRFVGQFSEDRFKFGIELREPFLQGFYAGRKADLVRFLIPFE